VFGRKNRLPLLEVFELSVAGRYEKFSDFGDAFKPKYGAAWRPHRNLLIRGSYNESFRAPNLVQTNTSPLQRSVSNVTDPYRSTVTQQITDGSSSRTVFRQGNSALEPEESDTSTVGFALEVPYVKGLTITVDWWRMNQEKVIDNLAAGGVLTRDQQLLDAFTQAQIAAGTSANAVATNSGENNYVGNPKVTRAPVTDADRAAFAAYNATRPASSHRAPVGRLVFH
jgi:outer membrane receptor protein involved in Fe transport